MLFGFFLVPQLLIYHDHLVDTISTDALGDLVYKRTDYSMPLCPTSPTLLPGSQYASVARFSVPAPFCGSRSFPGVEFDSRIVDVDINHRS